MDKLVPIAVGQVWRAGYYDYKVVGQNPKPYGFESWLVEWVDRDGAKQLSTWTAYGMRMAGAVLVSVGPAVASVDRARFPHYCPRCRAPAYIGFASVDCAARCG